MMFLAMGAVLLAVMGLAVMGLAIFSVVQDLIGRWRKNQQERLDDPWLKGVPLPKTDDPRWKDNGNGVSAWIHQLGLNVFRNGEVLVEQPGKSFLMRKIGFWPAYTRAVLRRLADQRRAEREAWIKGRIVDLCQDAHEKGRR